MLMFAMTLTLTFKLLTLGPEPKVLLSSYIAWPSLVEIEWKQKKKKFWPKKSVFALWYVMMTSQRKSKGIFWELLSRALIWGATRYVFDGK